MKTLKKGDQGEAVKILQHLLNYRKADLDVDGDYGQITKKAVIAFQEKNFDENGHSLNPDGIAGDNTWRALIEADQPQAPAEMTEEDPVTVRRIQNIHPRLREELRNIYAEIRERGVGVRFAQVFRSFEEQDALYAKGRTAPGRRVTNARGGQSYHNYGLAVDIVLLKSDGSVSWDLDVDFDRDGQADWDEIVEVFKHFGWKWGGDWTSFKDWPHFEKTFGYSTSELKRRYERGQFVEEPYVELG